VKNSFFLVIPKQRNEPHSLNELEAKALQHWLDDLPTANISVATRLLHDFVADLNTLAMPGQLRLNVLERIKPNVFIIEDYLENRLIKTGFPKDDNEKKIFEVLIAIEKECAIGYWTVLKELTHRNAGWFKGKNTAIAIQRCISKLARIVSHHFIMKAPVPDWVWIDLHSLYKLSVKLGHQHAKIVDHSKQPPKTRTPEGCYQQILLLSLAEPTGLAQKDIVLVYEFAEAVAALVSLKRVPVVNQNIQCMILMDEDKPPYFKTDVSNERESSVLYLDFNRLYKFMDQRKGSSNRADMGFMNSILGLSNQIEKPPTELMDYLQQRWFGINLQGSLLFGDRADRYVAIGLPSNHDAQKPSKSPGNTHKEQEEFLAQSASDRLLAATFNKPGVLSVGSLISFRKKDESELSRSLGIVNKLSVAAQTEKIIFGIQMLAGRFYTVTCKQRHAKSVQNGVFYSVKSLDSEKGYVITDYFMFEDNEIIDLSMEREDFPVIMKNRKNIGLGYWQFECQRIVEHTAPGQAKKGYDFI
jgi:cyclic-di-GMP-binding protein